MKTHTPNLVSTSFQSLEKSSKKFPILGKILQKVSNHWKNISKSFQSLENPLSSRFIIHPSSFILVFLLSFSSHAQNPVVLLSNGFNAATIPAGWTTSGSVAGSGSGIDPAITFETTSTYSNAAPYEGSYFVKFNSYYSRSNAQLRLVSPAVNASAYSNLYVKYAWFQDLRPNKNPEGMTVQWTTNGGSAWNSVLPFNSRQGPPDGWYARNLALPAAARSANLQIGFHFLSAYGDNCYLDDFALSVYTPVTNYPYSENFDSGLGIWATDPQSDFAWTPNTGLTPSGAYSNQITGPSGAQSGSYYLYTEASSPNYPDKTALLEAPFDFSSLAEPRLFFHYHMCGASMGSLYVDVSTDNGGSWTLAWSKTGEQQTYETNHWAYQSVNLVAYAGLPNVRIRFRGVTGSGGLGDMAIDSVSVSESVTIRSQSFDGADPTPWPYTVTPSAQGSLSTTKKNSGTYSYRLAGSSDGTSDVYIEFTNTSLVGYTNVSLLVPFATGGADSGDDLYVQISFDNGSTWHGGTFANQICDGEPTNNLNCEFGQFKPDRTTGDSNPWIYHIPGDKTQVLVRVRFYDATSNNTNDFYYLDDVKLVGKPLVTPTPLPVSEGFDAATWPDGWTTAVVADSGSSATPALSLVESGVNPAISPDAGSRCIEFNSYNCDSGDQIRLVSPVLSSSGKTNLDVNFSWYEDTGYSSYSSEGVQVQWSLDGVTWSNAEFFARYNASAGWKSKSTRLPAAANNQSSLRVAFLFVSQYGNNCHLDTVSIEEAPANTAPTDISLSSQTIAENAGANAVVGTLSATDAQGGSMTYSLVAGSGDTDNASFNISGTSLRANSSFNYENKSSYSVRIQVQDSGGLIFSKSFTITVTDANEAPDSANTSILMAENATYTFSSGNFPFTDPDSGNTLGAVRITSLPALGDLRYSSVAVTQNQIIAAANLGNLAFTPVLYASGSPYTTFGFAVRDASLFSSAYTLTINVTPDPCSGLDHAICSSNSAPLSGAHVTAGAAYTKTWVMSNAGNSAWASNTQYRLAFIRGDNLSTTSNLYLSSSVSAGQTRSFSLSFTAPTNAGDYSGYYALRHGATNFGERVWLSIAVDTPDIAITNQQTLYSSATTSITLGGTKHSTVTGTMRWTNALSGGSGSFAAASPWNVAVALASGENLVTISGTNASGVVGFDTIVLTRSAAPQIAITTAAATVSNAVSQVAIAGTATNAAGLLRWTNALTRASGTASADASWVIPDVALAIGTNLVTISATNQFGDTASDTVQFIRNPYGEGAYTVIFQDDFEDGDLAGWTQDIAGNWTNSTSTPINGDRSLKHNLASTAATNYIYATPAYDVTTSKTTWRFKLRNGNFDPTSNNRFYVVLMADTTNLKNPALNGYTVGVQMDGANDFLKLWRVTSGSPSALVTSALDWDASMTIGVEVTRQPGGEWELKYDLGGGYDNLESAGTASDAAHTATDAFGLLFQCTLSYAGLLRADDFLIFQQPADPVLLITTESGEVSNATTQSLIAGTCAYATGHLRWTNHATKASGILPVAADWSFNAALQTGANLIVVFATNAQSVSVTQTVTITRSTLVLPAAPVIQAASGVEATSFTANWSASSGATNYRLEVATDPSFSASSILLSTDFEESAYPPNGWTQTSVDRVSTRSHSPTNCIAFSAVTDWLVTPVVTNPATLILWTYWTAVGRTTVVEKVAGGVTSSVALVNNTLASAFEEVSVDVSSFGTGAFLFRKFGSGTLNTDDITLTGADSHMPGYEDLSVGNALSCSVTGLTPETTYYYRVRAQNAAGTSGHSDVQSATTAANPGDTDTDGDGIPDAYEIIYFGGATNGAATGDADFDGMNNLEEYIAGTNPTNELSIFLLEPAAPKALPGAYTITWPSTSNRTYTVFQSTNLSSGFTLLQGDVQPSPPQNTITQQWPASSAPFYIQITVKE